jgi:cobalt-zinc-cadmium efflux system outer membrane protein
MRSKTLAYAIGMACATWAAGSVLFMPAAARAQATSPALAPAQADASRADTATTQRLTLPEALSLAESANPALRAKQAQLAAAEGVQTDSNALLFNNPQLSTDLTRRTVPQAGQSAERRQEWSAGLSQTLEIAGQRGYRREAADAALAALRAEIADALRTARATAAERFYRVLALQQRVVLEGQALKLFEGTATAIQKRRAAGEDTKLDANIAAVEAERARNQLAIAQEQLLAARSELSATIQLPPSSLPEVVGELTMTPRRFSLADLLAAVDTQPRLRALVERENSATSKLKLEQASTYPDVTVGVNVGREGPGSARERLTTLTVSVPLPLFKRNATGIGQARSDLSQVQIERQTTSRDTRANVNALWLKLDSLESRVRRLQESMLPALADNQQLSVKSQQAGQIGLLELIVVNRQALDARRDLNDALSEYHATRLELELAAGWSQEATQP